MRFNILFSILLLASLCCTAEPIRLGILSHQHFAKITVTIRTESFELVCDDGKKFILQKGDVVDINAVGEKINLWFKGAAHKGFSKVELRPVHWQASFKIQVAGQKQSPRIYEETLEVKNTSGKLKLVNIIDIEKYVGGVVEAEAGAAHTLEYYKVQSVISRTYALNNLRRHEAEGFNLCDATHCQVYHGKPRSTDLAEAATYQTRDIVIVDSDINFITATFHSNCGGHTKNAEHVWSKPVPYLVGCPDSFCVSMPNAKWEKEFSASQWNNYLLSNHKLWNDSAGIDQQPQYRGKQFFIADSTSFISLPKMREDLKLRSTSFAVMPKGDVVKLMGYGFGHGVGLCQEGAINMARKNISYQDIIHFYYKDVHLVPRYMLWFFKED
ncbi:MAG: SpoIID/LytB domain-containing protein [Flavobacteriales bacterium]|nr:SpoIID/LytB domain-containing protein [Flavobacteriales bacterium]